MPTFSAALLAGGRSHRMGRDKALLPHPGGRVFWERQLAVLEELREKSTGAQDVTGPQTIFWSGPPRAGIPARIHVVADAAPDAGPLGGIVACLGALRSELLLVLAVDLVRIETDLLRRLLAVSTAARGAVVKVDSWYEPLAAVYPRALFGPASARLAAGQLALQDFLSAAESDGLMKTVEIDTIERSQFQNFNDPASLRSLG
jgi:molybdopterin-guanine dinucleotide biosynthesis protein A